MKNAADFDETYATIEQSVEQHGKTEEAEKIVEDMKAKVEEVIEKVATVETKKTVFVETFTELLKFIHQVITHSCKKCFEMIDAENIAADQEGWFKMDPEEIVKPKSRCHHCHVQTISTQQLKMFST